MKQKTAGRDLSSWGYRRTEERKEREEAELITKNKTRLCLRTLQEEISCQLLHKQH